MQLHQIKPTIKRKQRKRVGRGGKRGTYSGKGVKGQKARSGASFQPAIRTFIKRYHKLKGYRLGERKTTQQTINIEMLEKKFSSGDMISPKSLIEKKLLRTIKGKMPLVKILGKGEISKSLIVENCEVSKTAKEKIEKAGGAVK